MKYLLHLIDTNQKLNIMKPSAPTKLVWIIALLLGIIGIIGHFITIEYVSGISYWLLLAGFALLAIGTSVKGI